MSFVVPCYNYGRYLGDCLRSIFSQDGTQDFEIIAVDDGSADDTRDVLASFPDRRLRVVAHDANRGHAQTINEGIGLARGRFLARIDPDDRYRPYFLSEALRRFDTHPGVALVYGDVALIDQQGAVTLDRCDRVHQGREFVGNEFVKLLERNFICSATVIARREAWLSALPVPPHLAFHDWYFTLQIARRHDFCFVPRVLAEYRVHPANHHALVTRQKTEEPSIFWLLDRIFAERERSPEIERQKRLARRRVYAAHHLDLANKYFGFAMDRDARRCYLRALRLRPRLAADPVTMRMLLGSMIGRRNYDRLKAVLRRGRP